MPQPSAPSHSARKPKVMAVASGGGHWAELLRLRPAWDGANVVYVVTDAGYLSDLSATERAACAFRTVPDANKNEKVRLAALAVKSAWLVLRYRPEIVISTGAAPGYFAIRFAKLLGARTVWIDSIANAEEMSMSGQLARHHSDVWLTQWPHLETPEGPKFMGAVL